MKTLLKILFFSLLSAIFFITDLPVIENIGTAPAYAQERKPGFLQRLFGGHKSRANKERKLQKRSRGSRSSKRKVKRSKPKQLTALPKIEDANRILVIGDDTAASVARGLTDIYKRTPAVEITARTKLDLSIVGSDFYPWLDASDFTFIGERVKAIVVALGTHDRNDIVDTGRLLSYGTNEWLRAYRRRLVDVSAQLQLLNLPVIWVLPPPVIDNENSEKAVFIGSIQKQSFEPLNFRLVDVRDGFVNQKGSFRKVGANLSGSRVLLRRDDGIGFTKSGARKLAHYVSREIDTILDDTLNQGFVLQSSATSKFNTQQVVILTRPPLLPDAQLAGSNGRSSVFLPDKRAREYFVAGKPLPKQKGRVDDFSWPSDQPLQTGLVGAAVSASPQ